MLVLGEWRLCGLLIRHSLGVCLGGRRGCERFSWRTLSRDGSTDGVRMEIGGREEEGAYYMRIIWEC